MSHLRQLELFEQATSLLCVLIFVISAETEPNVSKSQALSSSLSLFSDFDAIGAAGRHAIGTLNASINFWLMIFCLCVPGPTTFSKGLCSVFFSVLLLASSHVGIQRYLKHNFMQLCGLKIANIIYGFQSSVMSSSPSLLSGAILVLSCPPPCLQSVYQRAQDSEKSLCHFRNQLNHGECCGYLLIIFLLTF